MESKPSSRGPKEFDDWVFRINIYLEAEELGNVIAENFKVETSQEKKRDVIVQAIITEAVRGPEIAVIRNSSSAKDMIKRV